MGLIPPDDCANLEPPEDCTLLFDIGESIAALAMTGLLSFIPDADCDPPVETLVSMGKPAVVPGCDTLAVWLTRFGPAPRRIPINECASGLWPELEAEYQVELWEYCYPSIDDLGRLPTPDELHRINAHVYAHGQAAYNAVLTGWLNKQAVLPPKVDNITFGALTPNQPNAKATGWTFTVKVVLG